MEIKVTVHTGAGGAFRATFHPAPETTSYSSRDKEPVRTRPVPTNSSVAAPGMAIALPAAQALMDESPLTV